MKLLYCIVLLGLVQCSLSAVPVKPSPEQQQLLQFYKQELNKINKEHCAEYKELFEKLLQDNTIKQGSTPTFQKFKQYAKLFLEKYSSYTNIGHHNELQTILDKILNIISSKMDKDADYIMQSMIKNNFEKIYKNNRKNYVSVVKNKFMPKFEEYRSHLTPQELKQQYALMEWFKNLKNCSDYNCYSKYFSQFPQKV